MLYLQKKVHGDESLARALLLLGANPSNINASCLHYECIIMCPNVSKSSPEQSYFRTFIDMNDEHKYIWLKTFNSYNVEKFVP